MSTLPANVNATSLNPMLTRRNLALLLVLLMLPAAVAARDGADPAINRPYLDADFEQWVERFERPGREVYDRRDAIVAATGVKPGMHVADIGAGTGLFTLMFARQVSAQGRVYAVDISRNFIANIEHRATQAGLLNITGIVSSQNETRLPPASIHLAFICDTYHHFEQPVSMLASIHRALKPGGILVVVDFERIEGKSSNWVLGHVRAGKESVIHEIETAGFHLSGDEKLLKENFYLRFTKK
jgi:ubiquinone/menaquinone biosynthesis C-methylase UbiE